MVKKILVVLLATLVGVVIWYWPLINYGLAQGIGQLNIVWKARAVSEVLADPSFPDSLKARLNLIKTIRTFAIDSLGLRDTENYTTVFDQKGREIMWVVTASKPFQLEPKTWDFPIVGSVPYKGFFDKEKAVELRNQLAKEGWDTSIRNPGGWSTLGWFNDPILSGMLDDSDGGLASTIIHEMVHSTIWVKDSVDYNENLASFIADTAAYDFLASTYGVESKPFTAYKNSEINYKRYSQHMLRGATALDSLYNSFSKNQSDTFKKEMKRSMISRIVKTLDTLTLVGVKKPSSRFAKQLPNNAYFMGFRHYQAKLPSFKKEMETKFKGDLKAYIKFLKSNHPKI